MAALDYIWRNPGATILQMRVDLCVAHQSITPAISNLLDIGLIREIGTERVGDSYYSRFQFVPDTEAQNKLSIARHQEKYRQWVKKGIEEFSDLMPTNIFTELDLIDLLK